MVGAIYIPIKRMQITNLRKGRTCAQGYKAGRWGSWDLNLRWSPGRPAPTPPAAGCPLPFVGVVDEGRHLPEVCLVVDNDRLRFVDLHRVEDGVEEGQPVDGRGQGLEGKRRA